jgi:hypothetical protein
VKRAALALAALGCACSGSVTSGSPSHGDAAASGGESSGGSAGTATSGGTTASGGTIAAGGTVSSGGGSRAAGGTIAGSGGTRATGGTAASGGAPGGNAGAGGAAMGGNAGAGGAASGGAGGSGGQAGACNALALDGPRVVPAAGTAAPPTPMGGSIPDGRWVMSAYEYYGGNNTFNPMRASYDIRGNIVQYVFQEEGKPLFIQTFSLAVAGTQVTKTMTCPMSAMQTDGFTATPSEIVFIRTETPTQTTVWHLTPK